MGLFSRKKKDDMEVQSLLDRANIASPTGAATAPAPSATPPAPAAGGGFQLPVEDVFSITGRGTVVTGQVAAGTVSKGMTVQVVRGGSVVASTRVTGVEMFRKLLDTATVGDNVGLLLEGVTREQVKPGRRGAGVGRRSAVRAPPGRTSGTRRSAPAAAAVRRPCRSR